MKLELEKPGLACRQRRRTSLFAILSLVLCLASCISTGRSAKNHQFVGMPQMFMTYCLEQIKSDEIVDVDSFMKQQTLSRENLFASVILPLIDNTELLEQSGNVTERFVRYKFQNTIGGLSSTETHALVRAIAAEYLIDGKAPLPMLSNTSFKVFCVALYRLNKIPGSEDRRECLVEYLLSDIAGEYYAGCAYLLGKKLKLHALLQDLESKYVKSEDGGSAMYQRISAPSEGRWCVIVHDNDSYIWSRVLEE